MAETPKRMPEGLAVKQAADFVDQLSRRQIAETKHRAETCGCSGCRGQAKQTQEWWGASNQDAKRRSKPPEPTQGV